MKDETPIESQEHRHRRGCARLVYFNIGLVLLVLLGAVFVLHKRNQITVSRETTYFTEPLDADGMVDYRAALNKRYGDVPNEENAAVVLLRITVPSEEFSPAVADHIARELNLARLQWPHIEWVAFDGDDELLAVGQNAPWSIAEYPAIAQWLEDNGDALQLAEDAAYFDQCFIPLLERRSHEFGRPLEPLLADATGFHSAMREVTRALLIRAMLELGEAEYDKASRTLLAAHRLARLIGQHPWDVPFLISTNLEMQCFAGHIQIAANAEQPAQWHRRQLSRIEKGPRRSTLEEVIGVGGRCVTLNAVAARPLGRIKSDDDGTVMHWLNLCYYADALLKEANAIHDRLATIAGMPRYEERQQALDDLCVEFGKSADGREGRYICYPAPDRMINDALWSFRLMDRYRTGLKATRNMARTAYALTVYQAEHGEYPESLDALVPDILDEMPIDPFDEKPLRYRRTDNGYVLYSVGPNMSNDGNGQVFGTCLGNVEPLDAEEIDRANRKAAVETAIAAGQPVLGAYERTSRQSWARSSDDIGVVVNH